MSYNIILNQNNITNLKNGNNQLTYNFPKTVTFKEGDSIALTHLNIFLSWFNVSASYNNNKFSYLFWDINGDLVPFEVVVPDGFYNNETFFEYFQQVMIGNGHYLESNDGQSIMYFVAMRNNITFYADAFIFWSISPYMDFGNGNELVADYYKPPTTWSIPSTYETMSIIFPAYGNMNKLFGFEAGSSVHPPIEDILQTTSTVHNVLSTSAPEVMPSSSYIINCSLVDNALSLNRMTLSSFTIPNQTGFGDLINADSTPVYSHICPGTYHNLKIELLDQDFQRLNIIDPNMLINLSIIKHD
jgi:hypothetical protein